jgi:ubiquitin conjugation factor E4 B
VRYPAFVNAMVQSPMFLPAEVSASTLEVETLLGPFFQLSPLQAAVTQNYFSSPKTRAKSDVAISQNALRMTLRTHQQELLDIINHIIKTGKEPRELTLDWFAKCVNSNHKRRALQVDQRTVSSDGFMINLTTCLDQLCEPFMDATFSKIDRIDVNYLKRSPRVDIKAETKLNADQQTSDEFYSDKAEGQNNFISEIFFLTLAAHHYGTEAANHTLGQLEKELKHMEKQIDLIEADREKFARNPRQLIMFENALRKYKEKLDNGLSYKMAVQGVLLDELTQTRSMQFMRYVIVWLMRLVSADHEFPRKPLKLPLPKEQSAVFRCLPEYFIEDVIDNFKFITRNMPKIITTTQSDELVMLCITFLRSSEYIKNPYLKAGLITIMFYGTWPLYGRAKGVLGDIFNSLPFANEHLLHSLMRFYIEVENTGAHTQFYDKFNIRYEIFQIIKCIWSSNIYRDGLAAEAKVNLEFFLQFVNLLLNDVTYVLDESLSAFVKIHDIQQLLSSPESSSLEPNVRTEREGALSDAQHRAKSYMQLANETVAMLKLFTAALADSFTMPEIVQRLADMLDYNLDALVGPKSANLIVKNPEEYGFNPKVLLAEITDVYLNLSAKENFITAVARDGRSYKPENFRKATSIFNKWSLKSQDEIKAWTELGEKFKRAKELDDQAEEDLGEIPDEFLGQYTPFHLFFSLLQKLTNCSDPLMATLMTDPVILPVSKGSIDRSTIRQHLLSDPTDPFNRSPLKIEDVIPDTALKARIDAFVAERKAAKRDIVSTESMDTSED